MVLGWLVLLGALVAVFAIPSLRMIALLHASQTAPRGACGGGKNSFPRSGVVMGGPRQTAPCSRFWGFCRNKPDITPSSPIRRRVR